MFEENVSLNHQDIEDAIENFDPKDLEEEIEKDPKKLSILCGGATGAGKSTLLNGLLGLDIFDENTLRYGTIEVTERTLLIKGIAVTIWITPGLEGSQDDENYLEDFKNKCSDFDIFLYCIKADETGAIELSDERSSLLKYTEIFGLELWKNAVVALTFSNKIADYLEEKAKINPDIDVTREFKRKIDEWETKIREALKEKFDMESAKRIPVLPTGIAHCRDLLGYDFWLSRLYVTFEDRIKEDGKFSFLKINQHRLRVATNKSSEDIEDQDIVYDKTFNKTAKFGKLSVLCGGATGSGKSTLLNGLMGFKINDLPVGNSLRRGTVAITERKLLLKGIAVTIWDTPGLEGSEVDKNYLEDIKKKCSDFDIFLYCIKANETRAIELFGERSSLLKYTEIFGLELWENAVVALTFSNKIEENLEEDAEVNSKKIKIDVKGEFKKKIDEWETKIRSTLEKIIDTGIAKRVPVLPTGDAECENLPGYDFWLSRLYVNFEDRMKEEGKSGSLKINQHRLTTNKKGSNKSKSIEDQDLVYDSTFKKNAKIAAVSTAVGVTGAVVGATIGATIGALAIGLPTFGVAAGVGLLLGGAIGGTAGGSTGAAASAGFMHWFVEKKKMKKIRKL